jgi:hypothetical protein
LDPGWKGLPRTNTLTYYEKIIIYCHKKFYNITTWNIYDLQRVVLVVEDDGGVVRLLAGGRVVRALEGAPDELLKNKYIQ